MAQVILSFEVPEFDGDVFLSALRRSWVSLRDADPLFAHALAAVLLLVPSSQYPTHAAAQLLLVEGVPSHLLVVLPGNSRGRRLNAGLQWALAATTADFWVHWDISYVCSASFWRRATVIFAVASAQELAPWQLQLTHDRLNAPQARRISCGDYFVVLPCSDQDLSTYDIKEFWPSFSLQPGVLHLPPLRVAFSAQRLPWFGEHQQDEVSLEWSFGLAMQRLGFVKSVLTSPIATLEPKVDICDESLSFEAVKEDPYCEGSTRQGIVK